MKKLISLFVLIFAVILMLPSFGCGGNKILTLTAFNTNIRIESHDKTISKQTEKKLNELFNSLEGEFDQNQPTSFISELNASAQGEKITLSQSAKELISLAKDYYAFSGGKFNPAIAPLTKLWQFNDYSSVVKFVPPTQEQVTEELLKINFDNFVVEDDSIYRADAHSQIDLGGLVKGYALDKALQIMLDEGHSSGYINIGNSSLALLSVESLNLSHPRKRGESLLTINAKNKSNITLSTSGDYERYFEYEDKRYSHIINPQTGYPIETGVASATVIGGTGAFTDAITTALCVCSHNPNDLTNSELVKSAEKILTAYPDSEIYIVYEKDGIKQLITNKKQGEDFTLLDTEYSVKNI